MPVNDTPAVLMTGVSFAFDDHPVLENIDLCIGANDFFGIIGPNGGGKTTLLKLMLGLLEPGRGRVQVFGRHPREVRDILAYVPQLAVDGGDFPITVADVVLQGRLQPRRFGFRFRAVDRRRAEEELERVGMTAYRRRPLDELSVGQRQRVFLARALCRSPRLLLLDEPTASLDAGSQTNLYEILRELNRSMGIVLVTHDIGVVSRHVRRLACVNRMLITHDEGLITPEMLEETYHCPVDLIAHGVPHRVLHDHG
ncbi:MAG: ATP-binding cassette domain-containing protein [Deltaproteobacteria bacterium]|nr:ATP-binding cassette domain-containing protein [Candidatus Anaeroferrophillacea bacterium]